MSYLVDTNAWIGFFEGKADFGLKAKACMISRPEHCYISLASVWEAAIKVGLGKLKLPYDLDQGLSRLLTDNGFTLLPLEFEIVVAVKDLPPHHGDPFDRVQVIQAQRRGLTVLSRDPIFERYGLRRIW